MPHPDTFNDYTHADDYDSPDADWFDYATLTTDFQLQVDLNNPEYVRHRFPATLGPWIKGRPNDASQ